MIIGTGFPCRNMELAEGIRRKSTFQAMTAIFSFFRNEPDALVTYEMFLIAGCFFEVFWNGHREFASFRRFTGKQPECAKAK